MAHLIRLEKLYYFRHKKIPFFVSDYLKASVIRCNFLATCVTMALPGKL